ncbi:hypothetical protein E2542_SST20566 [Spatholobus suberectus]|nr:hypothetical protein E2542_SST20566 [Spatholobus suberectus]
MSKSPSHEQRQSIYSASQPGEFNEATGMDDPESMMATVANFVEQLHANLSSPVEKEIITARLLGIARRRKDARALIGSHAQAMPLFINILRNGTALAKVHVASTLSVLCKDEDLRIKSTSWWLYPTIIVTFKL